MRLANCIIVRYENADKVRSVTKGFRNLKEIIFQDGIGLLKVTDAQKPQTLCDRLVNTANCSSAVHVNYFRYEV